MHQKEEPEYLVSDSFMNREKRMRLIAKCKAIPENISQRKKAILERFGLNNEK